MAKLPEMREHLLRLRLSLDAGENDADLCALSRATGPGPDRVCMAAVS